MRDLRWINDVGLVPSCNGCLRDLRGKKPEEAKKEALLGRLIAASPSRNEFVLINADEVLRFGIPSETNNIRLRESQSGRSDKIAEAMLAARLNVGCGSQVNVLGSPFHQKLIQLLLLLLSLS
ncbi:hypothetical protein TorRG33x02_009970 [Trema orientale]|uniref:Uncharacterized protein n=1 Tax=Trema orientale TaxID=63057 RepID=A0A2P5FYR4_TREOI|nr:hypothetical protein TorRG33x02_009970 [Trema orientale]